ncbi:hypothetical protein ACJX0J_037859, partial [Zea mays]
RRSLYQEARCIVIMNFVTNPKLAQAASRGGRGWMERVIYTIQNTILHAYIFSFHLLAAYGLGAYVPYLTYQHTTWIDSSLGCQRFFQIDRAIKIQSLSVNIWLTLANTKNKNLFRMNNLQTTHVGETWIICVFLI